MGVAPCHVERRTLPVIAAPPLQFFNRDDIVSGSYAERIRGLLSKQGFVVVGASGDSTVKHQITDINEGPHVDFFVADNCQDPKNTNASREVTSQEKMAVQIASLLNDGSGKPDNYGTFVVKCHSNYPSQVQFVGLWL
jgi:hypothetical protein